MLAADKRPIIDRQVVEYPGGFQLELLADGLTAPSAIAFDSDAGPYQNSIFIAESGAGDTSPRIYGFKPSGEMFSIYPAHPGVLGFLSNHVKIYGPIGGMVVAGGRIYVSHRDERGMGMVSAFDYKGEIKTIIAELPAQGDYALTDVAIHPTNGRLYFGLGAATNSGVVGLDNWDVGWVDGHGAVCDAPLNNIKLNGYRFTTPNPAGGLFGGDDIAVTAPFHAFGASRQLRIPGSSVGKPTAAVYSVNPDGGDLRVEAHGLRLPRGLAFNEFGNLFVTNCGMELRGTRPVKDDPDVVLRVPLGGQIWFGWPDFTANLQSINESRFQPPPELIIKTGYPELASVVDHEASGLLPPDRNLVRAEFLPLSGAAKLVFVPDSNQGFKTYRGKLIAALSGDRAPFASGNQKLVGPIGYKVMEIDPEMRTTTEFVVNAARKPGSLIGDKTGLAIERPFDVKFGPDGALYILDFGQMEIKEGNQKITSKSGRIYRLYPISK